MTNNIQLSIIIPAYNAQKTIMQTLNSIIEIQSDKIEIIVVNDGSSDNTLERIQSIKDQRLVVVSQKNAGVSNARNTGIKNSNGKYITFVDADDLVIAEEYDKILNYLIRNDVDAVYTGFDINEKGTRRYVNTVLKGEMADSVGAKQIIRCMLDYPYAKKKLSSYVSARVYQFVIKKSFLREYNILFPEHIHLAEDLCFCLRTLEYINTFRVWNHSTYIYNVMQGSALHRFRKDYFDEIYLCWQYLTKETSLDSSMLYGYLFAQGWKSVSYYARNYFPFHIRKCIEKLGGLLENQDFQAAVQKCDFGEWTFLERIEYHLIKTKHPVMLMFISVTGLIGRKIKNVIMH